MKNNFNSANEARKFSAKDRKALKKRRDKLNGWCAFFMVFGPLCFPLCAISGWFAVGLAFSLIAAPWLNVEATKYDDILY